MEKQQIHNLQHMLGFHNGKKPRRFFRNYWAGFNEDNEKMVELGYVEKYTTMNEVYYRALPKGIDFLLGYEYSKRNKNKLLKIGILLERDFVDANEKEE